jgi:hypothetical protein
MKKVMLVVMASVIVISIWGTSACNNDDAPPAAKPTLYDSLGGTALVTDPANPSMQIEQGRLGIRSVVDSTIFLIAADTLINGYFTVLLTEIGMGNTSGFEELSKNLTDFFCVATGATHFNYAGLSMTDAHNPATNPRIPGKVNDASFDQFIVDLVAGAHKNGLPDNLINSIGALVETLRSQIVQV